MKQINKTLQSGFTLIEIAIVIVIIGMLIIGIYSSGDLLNNYKTASIIADFKKYKSAYDNFKQQYNAIPGDMVDASTVLPNPSAVTILDGNGDSKITTATDWTSNEAVSAWQHMALAGFIKGNYTVVAGANPPQIDINIPKSTTKSRGFFMADFYTTQITNGIFSSENFASLDSTYNNAMIHSNSIFYASFSFSEFLADYIVRGSLTPEDAHTIDIKLDDGLYRTGIFSGMNGKSAEQTCRDAGDATKYNISTTGSNTGTHCIVFFNIERTSTRN